MLTCKNCKFCIPEIVESGKMTSGGYVMWTRKEIKNCEILGFIVQGTATCNHHEPVNKFNAET